VVVANTRGKIHLATPAARRWMRSHFTDWGSESERLPLPLQQITHRCAELERITYRQIITAAAGGTQFTITAVKTKDLVVLVFERASDIGPPLHQLTRRQTEVLSWVAEGKKNEEISKILLISPRTVQHHLERVYERLGVENRTAAATMLFRSRGQSA
jgi:DNA-binding CsgD family transcriptional regulator